MFEPTGVTAVAAEKAGVEVVKATLWKRATRWHQRGVSNFAVPAGKIVIVVPERPHQTGMIEDLDAARLISALLVENGRVEGKDFELVKLPHDQELTDTQRKQNLILLCGSNPMWRRLITKDAPGFLSRVQYVDSESRDGRKFLWNRYVYGSTQDVDHAIIAVKPNPYNSDRTCIVLFGSRAIGTLGAARAYCLRDHRDLRKTLNRHRAGSWKDRDLEVLIRVKHERHKSVGAISLVREEDGLNALNAASIREMTHANTALRNIAISWRHHPRPIVVSDYEWEMTFHSDFSTSWDQRYTLSAGSADVVFLGIEFSSSSAPFDGFSDLCVYAEEIELDGSSNWVVKSGGAEWVPTLDDPARKEFLLFPIPPIQKEDGGRRFRVRAMWPRAATKLGQLGVDDLTTLIVPHYAASAINKVRVSFHFDCDGTFEVAWRVQVRGGKPISRCSRGTPFVYEGPDVEPGKLLQLAVRRVG